MLKANFQIHNGHVPQKLPVAREGVQGDSFFYNYLLPINI